MADVKRWQLKQLRPFFYSKNNIKRINRAKQIDGTFFDQRAHEQTKQATKNIRKLKQIDAYILCILLAKNGQLSHHDQELLYVAQALSQKWQNCAVLAVVLGNHQQDLSHWGADRVIGVDYDILQHYQMNELLALLAGLFDHYQPKHMLFADDDWGGGDLLRRFAVYKAQALASDVIEIDVNEVVRLIDNGGQESFRALPVLLGLKSGVSDTELDLTFQASMLQQDTKSFANKASDVYKMPARDIPIEQTNLLMSLGNGVADMQLFIACAKALGATVGGSRVVVDDGKLPRECQIGATGKNAAAHVYFGVWYLWRHSTFRRHKSV